MLKIVKQSICSLELLSSGLLSLPAFILRHDVLDAAILKVTASTDKARRDLAQYLVVVDTVADVALAARGFHVAEQGVVCGKVFETRRAGDPAADMSGAREVGVKVLGFVEDLAAAGSGADEDLAYGAPEVSELER